MPGDRLAAVYTLAAFFLLALLASHAHAYPSYITLQGRGLAYCRGWLVTSDSIIYLPSGERHALYAPAGSALCSHGFIIAVGDGVVMVYRPPRLVAVYRTNATLVGAAGAALLFHNGSAFTLATPGGSLSIPAPYGVLTASFAIVGSVPVVVYDALLPNGSTEYIAANPFGWRGLGATGPGGVYLGEDGTVILAVSDGLAVGRLDPVRLTLRINYTVYVPVPVARIARVEWPKVYGYTPTGDLVTVDLERRTWRILGAFRSAPAGLYDPAVGATLVPAGEGLRRVPGYAFARLGDVVLTAVNDSTIVYPLVPSILHMREDATVTIIHGGLALRVRLHPGDYIVPRGSVVLVDGAAVPVAGPEAWIPARRAVRPTQPPASLSYTPVALEWPQAPIPIDNITGVSRVYAGSGRLIIIRGSDAIVYTEYGAALRIPGVWEWGVPGAACLALYDGESIHVYDYGGARLAVYGPYELPAPLAGSCRPGPNGPVVTLVYSNYTIVVGPRGAERLPNAAYTDPASGITYDYRAGVLRYASSVLRAPPGTIVNGYQAAWYENGALHILDLRDGRLYIVLGAPRARYYPVGGRLAVYANGTLLVYPFKSWLSACYVRVDTEPYARVYVGSRLVSIGPVTVYAPCGSTLTITARAPWMRPATATVVVVPGGRLVSLHPRPVYTNVTVDVRAPEGLRVERLELQIDNRTVAARPGSVLRIWVKPHDVTVTSVTPRVCQPEPRVLHGWVPRPPRDTLVINCVLATPVLALRSNVTVNVFVYSGRGRVPVAIREVAPNETVYVALPAGVYRLVSRPVASGYAPRVLNVTLPEGRVVIVDVTPVPLPRLIVRASPPTAVITVAAANGTVVARARGRLVATLEPGSYTVRVAAPGYNPATLPVKLEPGQVAELNVTLVPAPVHKPRPRPWWENPALQAAAAAGVAASAAAALIWRRRRRAAPEVEEGGAQAEAQAEG